LKTGRYRRELVRALAAIGSTARDVIASCKTCAPPEPWKPKSR